MNVATGRILCFRVRDEIQARSASCQSGSGASMARQVTASLADYLLSQSPLL